jgi:hypothetical protein
LGYRQKHPRGADGPGGWDCRILYAEPHPLTKGGGVAKNGPADFQMKQLWEDHKHDAAIVVFAFVSYGLVAWSLAL